MAKAVPEHTLGGIYQVQTTHLIFFRSLYERN